MKNDKIETCDSVEQLITVLFNDEWYLIPFFCLHDIVIENAYTKIGDDQLNWIEKNTKSTQQNAIEEFHKHFDTAMVGMSAYKLYY